jgi:hypothetical protein
MEIVIVEDEPKLMCRSAPCSSKEGAWVLRLDPRRARLPAAVTAGLTPKTPSRSGQPRRRDRIQVP